MTIAPKKLPVCRQIAEALRHDIAEGVYAPGQQLPSLRQLADEYHVSTQPVRYAFEELILDGLIVTVRGDATYVAVPKGT